MKASTERSLFFACLLASTIFSPAALCDKTDFDWDTYGDFIQSKNFDEAWEMIKDVEDGTKPTFNIEKGVLLGSGNLSVGVQRCEAVRELEAALELGAITVTPLLNALYAGDWISFASMEGSRSALEYLGGRVLDYGDIDHVFFLDDKRAAREAAPYYFLSANLGYKVAARRIARWGKKYPGIFGIYSCD